MDFFDYYIVIALVVFYIVFIGRSIKLALVEGTNPFVIGKGKTGFKGILEILFMVGLVIWTYEVIINAIHTDYFILPRSLFVSLFDNLILKITGCILIAFGLVIFILSLISFGKSWRVGIDKENPGSLVTTGIFSITRNPIFVFLDLYFVSTWLIYSNLFFLISSIIIIIGIHYQILQEEKFLLTKYGKEYENYKMKVRRYI
jgi:protein-S-isoprenylcysteine O-methyltransferase Ste14